MMSALPAAQQVRKAKLIAELGASIDRAPLASVPKPDTPPDPPLDEAHFAVEPTPPADPPPAPPTPPAPPAKTAAEIERDLAEQRWNTLQGMFNTLKEKNAQLESELAELRSRPAPATPLPAPSAPTISLPDPSDKEFDVSGDEFKEYTDAFPVINKLAKKNAAELINQVIKPFVSELASLREEMKNGQQKIDLTSEEQFVSQIRSQVPDFDTITAHPNWRPFLQERAPFTSTQFGQALMAAHQGRQLGTVKEILGKFRELHMGQPTGIPSALAAPPASGASPTPSQPTSKPTLRWSEREKAHKDFTMGRITHDKLRQIDALYKAADAEGRVDYNA